MLALDAATLAMTGSQAIAGHPDYVRVAPTTSEVWVTIPDRDRIAIVDPGSLALLGRAQAPEQRRPYD